MKSYVILDCMFLEEINMTKHKRWHIKEDTGTGHNTVLLVLEQDTT